MAFFDEKLASKYGAIEAIFIDYIAFTLLENHISNINFYNGYYWFPWTTKQIKKQYSFLDYDDIGKILKNLKKQNVIDIRNFDNTKWYTIIDDKVCELYRIHAYFSVDSKKEAMKLHEISFEDFYLKEDDCKDAE